MKKKQTKKALREHNQKAVLSLLRNSGPISITEISKKIHLSNNTITKVIEHYIAQDLIRNSGKGESTYEGGKKPNLFSFNPEAKFAIGMQLHYDEHLYAVLTDLNVMVRQEVSIPLKWNTKIGIVLDDIAEAYKKLIEDGKIDRRRLIGLAIGTHGVTNSKKGIIVTSPHNPVWGKSLRFKDMVTERIEDNIPIHVDNQIRFQAFAENHLGSGKNDDTIIVIRCGVGAIAGIVQENDVKRGKHFLAGSIGHMILDPHEEEVCMCGGRGCFEVLISTDRILNKAREGYRQNPDSLIFSQGNPEEITIKDVFDASNRQDRFAQSLLDEVIGWFAIAIHNLMLMYDPDVVIIQGAYSKAGDYFIANLRKQVKVVSLVELEKDIRIEYSLLGEKAGAIGAAAYLITEFFK